ncbi:TonB-dependent receptor [Algibacter pacificus]|uniref:TonB-dependent receptor n=1 Tax=Algibacter pacificus TaxID=2599389 RepID=UPI0021CFD1B9|nr:TonB-dependent receptor [Algibacter pacificus]
MWLCFSIYTNLFAQNSFQIKGLVVSAKTLQPVEGANIIGKKHFAISSNTGEFTVNNLSKGTYIFTVSHMSYAEQTVSVTIEKTTVPLKIFLTEAPNVLSSIEVIGKTNRRKLMESPVVAQNISKTFLNNNRENSLMQTLSKIPGVNTINIGSGQSKPVIRGLGFNRVVVVQNGIKHEAQQWGNDHGLEIDQYGIERIQIVKGPASLVYGSDAIAGVINIQPNAIPTPNSFKAEVNITAESNNDLLGISTGLESRKENWFYRGRLTYRDYADYKVPTDVINYENYVFKLDNHNLRNTAGQEANMSFSVGYTSDNITSETFFSNVNAKNGFFANAHGLEVRSSSIDYDGSNRDIDLPFHKVNHFKITNNSSFSKGNHTYHVNFGFQNNYREEHSEPVPHGYMPKPENSRERVFNKNTYALTIKDDFKPNTKHDIVMGLNTEFQDNNIGGWGFLIPKYNRFTVGVFAYDQFEVRPNLHILTGLRYDFGVLDTQGYFDWYSSKVNNNDGTTSNIYLQRSQDKTLNFGNISASTGLSFINNNTTYKINIGKSFRMPLPNELASDGVNYHMYRYEQGNLDLDSEESYQLDLDIEHTAKKFYFGISPFVNFFQNYIYLNPTPNYYETLQIYEYTQAKVFRIGSELSASTSVFNNLELNASAEYVFSKQTSGPKKDFTLPFAPPLSGLFSANYQLKDMLGLKKTQLIAEYRITAAQKEIVPPEEVTAGYQVLNLSLLTQIKAFKNTDALNIRLKLNNVFNTKYYNHTSFYRLIDVPEAGRNISIALTVPFNK